MVEEAAARVQARDGLTTPRGCDHGAVGPWDNGPCEHPASVPATCSCAGLIVLAVVQAVSAIGGALAMVFGDGAGFDESG